MRKTSIEERKRSNSRHRVWHEMSLEKFDRGLGLGNRGLGLGGGPKGNRLIGYSITGHFFSQRHELFATFLVIFKQSKRCAGRCHQEHAF